MVAVEELAGLEGSGGGKGEAWGKGLVRVVDCLFFPPIPSFLVLFFSSLFFFIFGREKSVGIRVLWAGLTL